MEKSAAVPVLKCAPLAPEISPDDFDRIVRLHQGRIYRVLLLLLRDPEAADDLTQECFMRAFAKRASFRGEASLGTWLMHIAVNLARDHKKNRRLAFWRGLIRGRSRTREELPDPHRSPESILEAREKAAAVWAAVDKLTSNQRTAFILRFSEEMSLEEIAAAMRIELGTVKSHLARALRAVREHLRNQAINGPTS